MIKESELNEMKETEEKQLLMILKESGKPYVKKHDGIAVKMTEDKQIQYKDYEENERTLKVPAGSYVICEGTSHYPKIVTAEEFEENNKFVSGDDKPATKGSDIKIGIESMG